MSAHTLEWFRRAHCNGLNRERIFLVLLFDIIDVFIVCFRWISSPERSLCVFMFVSNFVYIWAESDLRLCFYYYDYVQSTRVLWILFWNILSISRCQNKNRQCLCFGMPTNLNVCVFFRGHARQYYARTTERQKNHCNGTQTIIMIAFWQNKCDDFQPLITSLANAMPIS